MKKIAIVVCVIVYSLGLIAQQRYEIGDVVPQGTWNALVVYVDESGQHGLLMSPTAWRTGTFILKQAAKKAGLSVEDFAAQLPLPLMPAGEGDTKIRKVQKAMLQNNLNGVTGVENSQNIANYCEENGLPMETYFPEVYWASQLGDGWFIPGTAELELYAQTIAYGVGKKNYKGNYLHADKKRQALNQQIIEREGQNVGVFFPQYIGSSTFADNVNFAKDPANKDKIAKVNGLSIAGNIKSLYFGLALFSNGYMQSWYVLNNKGIDYQPYTNAFKWF